MGVLHVDVTLSPLLLQPCCSWIPPSTRAQLQVYMARALRSFVLIPQTTVGQLEAHYMQSFAREGVDWLTTAQWCLAGDLETGLDVTNTELRPSFVWDSQLLATLYDLSKPEHFVVRWSCVLHGRGLAIRRLSAAGCVQGPLRLHALRQFAIPAAGIAVDNTSSVMYPEDGGIPIANPPHHHQRQASSTTTGTRDDSDTVPDFVGPDIDVLDTLDFLESPYLNPHLSSGANVDTDN